MKAFIINQYGYIDELKYIDVDDLFLQVSWISLYRQEECKSSSAAGCIADR